MVVERRGALVGVGVEHAALAARGHRHADRVADALAERAGGGLDTGGVAVLRVTGGLAAPGAQRLDVLELEAPAAEEELEVERQRRVSAGEDEAVAARPVRVGGVVAHHLLEQQVRRRGQAHGGAGVAVADLLHGIHREHPDRVHGLVVELGPVQRGGSAHQGPFGFAPGGASVRVGHDRAYSRGRLDSHPLRNRIPSPSEDLRDLRRPVACCSRAAGAGRPGLRGGLRRPRPRSRTSSLRTSG